uniref:Uncharacterized protein n=1 Tax=Spongospora subterranea TaxID=70186 RepID=A0A0H5RCF6_9EUKA|eukprot:CRZ11925.1 hypothetical protein [Spongospora subterranea]
MRINPTARFENVVESARELLDIDPFVRQWKEQILVNFEGVNDDVLIRTPQLRHRSIPESTLLLPIIPESVNTSVGNALFLESAVFPYINVKGCSALLLLSTPTL